MWNSWTKKIWQTSQRLALQVLGTSGQIIVTELSGGRIQFSLPDPLYAPGEVILPNETYLQAVDAAGTGLINLVEGNADDEVQPGADFRVAGMLGDTNPGDRTLYDAPITAASPVGTSHSNALKLNGTTMFRWFTQSDGAGDIQNSGVRAYPAWDDLAVNVSELKLPGISDPENIVWLTHFDLRCFNNADVLKAKLELPHDYLLGSTIYAHAHWTPHTRGVAEGAAATVFWQLQVDITEIDGVFTTGTQYDLVGTCDGVDHSHLITPSKAIVGPSTLSAAVNVKITRAAGDTWATNTPTNRPGLLWIDFHYQRDGLGSENETSKVA